MMNSTNSKVITRLSGVWCQSRRGEDEQIDQDRGFLSLDTKLFMAEPGEENTGIIILRLTKRILLGKYNTCWLLFCSKGVVHKLRNHFWGVPRFLHDYITFALKHLVAECFTFKPSFSSNPKSSWPEDLSLVLLRQGVTAPNVHCRKTTPPSSVSALVVSAAVHKNHILRMELLLQLWVPDHCSVVCTELALICIQLQVQLIYHLHFLENTFT